MVRRRLRESLKISCKKNVLEKFKKKSTEEIDRWNDIFLKKMAFQAYSCQKHTKRVGKVRRFSPFLHMGRGVYLWQLSTGQTHSVFGELLISFSSPLLKLEPHIYTGCSGFMVHLLLCSGLTQGARERGVGGVVHGFMGTHRAEMTPSCRLFRCKEKQAQSGSHTLTHCSVTQRIAGSWCVNITGSINLTVDLSLARYVCVSLTEVDKVHLLSQEE